MTVCTWESLIHRNRINLRIESFQGRLRTDEWLQEGEKPWDDFDQIYFAVKTHSWFLPPFKLH